ncbi:GNAT family N-acetyltransferase [Edaphobacillus lindanitolerans]|uniref:N-acetyltransferase domain-containing protein n=1 Tax=Edaphobacillus lindanitolerans TaxID=550447 RepID=A0A1U7PMG6_9BACI|nr:N-acetyltransferase [Edaphobacillus lindanitolerans]SIT70133.1 hypothetical protein SAMN05428946_0572 [Edaphobacillus lindanitolerans]
MGAYHIRPAGKPAAVADFLERLNRMPSSHIGYCGEDREEILQTLEDDFSDMGFDKSFWVAEEGGITIGALGLDIDEERKSAEVWGPFVAPGRPFKEVAERLWKEAAESVSGMAGRFEFFLNEENTDAAAFAERLGAVRTGRHVVLQAERRGFRAVDEPAFLYDRRYENAFRELHETEFPGTYLSPDELLDGLDGSNRLFVIPDEQRGIKGYVYVEAVPVHGEGTIEFIAVSPEHRRQGVATRLLRTGLAGLFDHEKIASIRLAVEGGNEAALGLYEAAGFRPVHRLTAWKLER